MVGEDFENRCASLLEELGLARRDEIISVVPLTGGVASDIAKIETENGDYCVKFALEKLRVKEEWHAPVHRNAAEYAWLEVASEMALGYFPKLFGRSTVENGFVMEFVSGDDVFVWKDALMDRGPVEGEAGTVARLLAGVHQRSARAGFDRRAFDNAADFSALRLEPYLRFVGGIHTGVADTLNEMADDLFAAQTVLVHGDVSPKNILFRDGAPVLLDAECATMGCASFDVAFCLNHLLLKGVHTPEHARRYLSEVSDFVSTYLKAVDWEDVAALSRRIAHLLPMLMLARVDGKSPVEYLDEAQRARVRAFSLHIIAHPEDTLDGLFSRLTKAITS